MARKVKATLDDLYRVPEHGKAELVDGELIRMAPAGFLPNRAAGAIYASLRAYERRLKRGYAVSDNAGFRVNLPHRESFSPDAAFHMGGSTGMRFLEGAPVFAVEVRSEGDYGPAAARDRSAAMRTPAFPIPATSPASLPTTGWSARSTAPASSKSPASFIRAMIRPPIRPAAPHTTALITSFPR